MRILTYLSTLAVFLLTLCFSVPCTAQIAVPLTTSLPLEVRSPYLNFWTQPSNTSGITTTSAEFFAKAVRHVNSLLLAIHLRISLHQLSGRTALLRIDGVTHSIFGQLALANRSNVTGSFITPTRTIFTLDVGPVEVSVTFLSPIEVRVEVSLFKCMRSLIILAAIRPGSTINPFHVHILWIERDGWENS
jgi:hypothetical protein